MEKEYMQWYGKQWEEDRLVAKEQIAKGQNNKILSMSIGRNTYDIFYVILLQ